MSGFFNRLGTWLLRIAAGAVILLALLVGVARLLLPEAPRFADDVRRAAQQATGFDIDFQLLSAGVSLYGPELRLTDVTVNWPTGEQAFAAGEISIAVDVVQLITQQQVAPALLHIEDLAAELEITAEGSVLLQGRPLEDFAASAEPGQQLQALRVSLEDVDVRFADRQRGIAPVGMSVKYLLADIDTAEVAVEADIRLAADLAEKIEIDGVAPIELFADRAALTSADRWSLSVNVDDFRLGSWMQLTDQFDSPVLDGEGAASAELEFAGIQPAAIRVDADISELLLSQPGSDPVYYDSISGEVSWKNEAAGWQASGRDLRFVRDGQRRLDGQFRVNQRSNEDGSANWSVSAESLSLTDLMPFATALVAPQLQEAGISGRASGDIWRLQSDAELVAGELREYSVEGDFENLGYVDAERGINARG
ncbi:MAG: hypothetical protein KJP03_05860, partial [Gammaproteobacteria bacterium]|nr:hypothetical protein [Gammaproteobacteria bacterium]